MNGKNKTSSMLSQLTPKRSIVVESRNTVNAVVSSQSPINRCNTGYVEAWHAERLDLMNGQDKNDRASGHQSKLRVNIPTKIDNDAPLLYGEPLSGVTTD